MKRLDEMSFKELKRLYFSEKGLRTVPALLLIPFILALLGCLGLPLFICTIIVFILIGLICNYGRTCLVKWLIRGYSFLLTVGILALVIKLFYDLYIYNSKFELTWQYIGGCIIYFGVVIFFTLIPANICYISFTQNMWGKGYHTYLEISEAYKLARKGEIFSDENLKPSRKMSSVAANIIAVVLFLLLVVLPIASMINTSIQVSIHRENMQQKAVLEESNRKIAEATAETEITEQPVEQVDTVEVVPKLKEESEFDQLIKLAEKGDAQSLYKLGDIYYRGDVVEQNYPKAIEYFEQAAQLKDDDAIFRLGRIYYFGRIVNRDYSKAMKYFQECAKNGNSEAQEFIAQMYFDGTGVEQNYYKAFDYFFKAAAKDNSTAQFSVGYMLAKGLGTEKNIPLAIKYLEISADKGNTDAQNYLEKLKK